MKVLIVTANIGDIDFVIDVPKQIVPDGITVDYKCYTEKNLPFPLPNLDNRLKSKYLKIQTHIFEPNYDYYIWIDGRIEIKSEYFVDQMLTYLGENDIALPLHEFRNNVFEEMDFISEQINKESPYVYLRYGNQFIDKEIDFYKERKKWLSHIPLHHCACFIRVNNYNTKNFFDEWWSKCIQFSNFDQAMFCYVHAKSMAKIRSIKQEDIKQLIINNKHQRNMINLSTDDVYFKIKSHLIKKLPLAITRYGDGEAMLLDKEPEGEEYREYVFKRQLGDNISDEHKSQIRSHLRSAYRNSDIIGIPTSKHKSKGDYWNKAQDILERHTPLNKDYCSIDIHQEFLSQDFFKGLLTNRKKVYYISAYNIDNQLKEQYNIEDVQSFQIAPEIKFNPQYEGEPHYPNHFNEIGRWINTLDCEGALCLVGAGVTGKIYNTWFKNQGGVSMDIGSVFDAWVGKNTRGKDRGANAVDNTYKL